MALSILQWNARSLNSNSAFLKTIIADGDQKPDIICIQETFFTSRNKFSLQGYSILRLDRKSPRGGAAILIKSSISYSELKTPKNVESLGIQIYSNVGKINIYNVYNPGIDINKEEYELFFRGDIICGDFNAHNPIWGSKLLNKRGEVLEELFLQSECVIINNGQGTHIYICSPTEDSPLDLTFIDKYLLIWQLGLFTMMNGVATIIRFSLI